MTRVVARSRQVLASTANTYLPVPLIKYITGISKERFIGDHWVAYKSIRSIKNIFDELPIVVIWVGVYALARAE